MIANRRVIPKVFVKSIIKIAAVSDYSIKDTCYTVKDNPI